MSLVDREKKACLGIDPLLSRIAMGVTQDFALRYFFSKRIILGQENLPLKGSVVLAPTHRSRWDALMLTMAAGRRVTNRDCRFMVTQSEMKGLQGWFLNRLGCFSIDQYCPSLLSLRYSVDLLVQGEQLVVFPEGRIRRSSNPKRLKEGLFRIAQLAHKQGVEINVLPIGISYSEIIPNPLGLAAICFANPLKISDFEKIGAKNFNVILSEKMHLAEEMSLKAVGRK
ncbi:lysophospholipid acyltransferase family protein [Prochlorococcus sp. MIT 1223]|uniref:lysophospholipid acyltransferase family protein n=1 Tax=Prochlorococcus sp. MIT 1223 TaxID=3096217 RepID=UPI002A752215|nr:lysophospholipid acyltransferase family protein [Prochlorococcus sp. MIT 1223]